MSKHILDNVTAPDIKSSKLQITFLKKLFKGGTFIDDFKASEFCSPAHAQTIDEYLAFITAQNDTFVEYLKDIKGHILSYISGNPKLQRLQKKFKAYEAYKKSIVSEDSDDGAAATEEGAGESSLVTTMQQLEVVVTPVLVPTLYETIQPLLEKIENCQRHILDLTDVKRNVELTLEYTTEIKSILSSRQS